MTSMAARITAQVRTALRKFSECDGRCRGRYGCEPADHLQEPLENRYGEAVRTAYGVEIEGRHAEVFEYRDRSIGVFADDGRAVAHAWTVTRAANQCVARQALCHDRHNEGVTEERVKADEEEPEGLSTCPMNCEVRLRNLDQETWACNNCRRIWDDPDSGKVVDARPDQRPRFCACPHGVYSNQGRFDAPYHEAEQARMSSATAGKESLPLQ